jgi:16S rRNA (uracil1498-N3)-methyltransferase
MTRRRWIADSWDQATASLTGEQASHLIRVLRAQAGMEFDIVAGDRVWHAVIAGISGDAVRFNLVAEVEAEPALPITLLLSIFKFDRMEWAIEKAVELGCLRILPVLATRTEKHLAQAAEKRVERWRRIAFEAAKQSRRSDLPEIPGPTLLDEVLAGEDTAPLRILLSEMEEDQPLLRVLEMEDREGSREIALAIGPEGGWTAAEIAAFTGAGWHSASLGPHILRAETAAIAALAVVNAYREISF